MADRSIKVTLKADTSAFVREINRSAQSLDALAKKAGDTGAAESGMGRLVQSVRLQGQAWTAAGTAAAATGAAVLGVGALAVREFATFDQAMSGVASTGADARNSLAELREAALQAGADTAFSAVEAANGVEELARAGVSAKDVLGGGLTGALDLAAAGQLSVADAAGIASTAMTQFKLSGEDVPHVADLLAAGAGKAMGGVDDLGMALKQSGLVASQFGLSVEETVGGLSAFASAGLLGSDAGTSLKAMLLALAKPSKESSDLMAELGINAYDTSGKFIGLEGLAGQLQARLAGLTDAQRQQALGQIFGNDAIRAASVLYDEGAEGIANWTAAVDDAGYAAMTAATLQDNLIGDLEKLGGSWSTLAITMGESADGPLRSAVQGLTGLMDAVSGLPDPIFTLGTALGSLAGAGLLGAGGLMFLLPKTLETVSAFRELGVALPGAEKHIGRIGKAAGVAAAGFAAWTVAVSVVDAFAAKGPELEATAAAIERIKQGTEGLSSLDSTFRALDGDELIGGVDSLSSAIKQLADVSNNVNGSKIAYAMESFAMLGNGQMDKLAAQFGQIDSVLSSIGGQDAAPIFAKLRDEAFAAGVSMDTLVQTFPKYAAEMQSLAAQNGLGELSASDLAMAMSGLYGPLNDAVAASEGVTGATGEMTAEMQAAAEASQEYLEVLKGYADADAGFIDLMGAWQAVAEKAAEATESSEDSWEDFYDGQSLALSDYLAELEAQVQAQTNWETNMVLLAGRASAGLLEYLASLGPEGAPLVQALVDGTDAELAQMEGLFAQRGGEATGAFAEELDGARAVWAALAQKGGASAVASAAAEFAAGKTTIQGIIDRYDLTATLNANTDPAIRSVQATIARINNMSATVRVRAYHANGLDAPVATGGYIRDVAAAYGLAGGGMPRRWTGQLVRGPGTSTSDDVPARLSRDEFVTRAAAVDYYGPSLMYAMNAKQIPREAFAPYGFAGGGQPQPAPPLLRLPATQTSVAASLSLSDGDVARIAEAVRIGASVGTHAGIAARAADARVDSYRGL